jgi:endonuclease YncB( thermonuclease family)
MAKGVEQTQSGRTIAHARFVLRENGTRMSVKQAVHDGDTVNVDPDGHVSVRLLGVDAPEVSFTLPDRPPNTFLSIESAEWTAFLADPFAVALPAFDPPLSASLLANLQARLGATCASNHARFARSATRTFEGLIDQDSSQHGLTTETFRFFLSFANDVIDRYGRFLGFLNIDLPVPPRPLSYNERLLADGHVIPYFIWPNINPFRRPLNLLDAVPAPGQPIADPSLDRARQSVRDARAAHRGVFEPADPLQLLPFELRYLARTSARGNERVRGGPDRWVIDLAAGDDRLLPPPRYIEIPNAEDRLFVPVEYVPLFVEAGWQRS